MYVASINTEMIRMRLIQSVIYTLHTAGLLESHAADATLPYVLFKSSSVNVSPLFLPFSLLQINQNSSHTIHRTARTTRASAGRRTRRTCGTWSCSPATPSPTATTWTPDSSAPGTDDGDTDMLGFSASLEISFEKDS